MAVLENTFKRIDGELWTDGGANNAGDYITQISWVLFLKYLEDLESRRKTDAELNNKSYSPILREEFRWHSWAVPLKSDGNPDVQKALVGRDLLEFVNDKLFPYLRNFKNTTEDSNTIEYKIGEIFTEIDCKIQTETHCVLF